LKSLSAKPNPTHTVKDAFRKADRHDLPEVLTTDFPRQDIDIITREDKARLEELAARILYEAYPDRYRDFHEYEHKLGKDDVIVKIADLLAWAGEAIDAYATTEYFDKTSPETLEQIIEGTRTIMQKYPEAYEAFGNAYLLGMQAIAETLLQDIASERRKNPRDAAAKVIELAAPSVAA